MSSPDSLDKSKIARSFSRAAKTYDKYANLQQSLAKELVDAVGSLKIKPVNILDIGTGTGEAAFLLKEAYPSAKITGIDIAPGMIDIAKSKPQSSGINFEVADAERLPYKSGSFDLVVSASTLHWVADIRKAFREAFRMLKEDGCFIFETFGPDTLIELRSSFMLKVDSSADYFHEYLSMDEIRKILEQCQFNVLNISSKNLKQLYDNSREIFKTIKGLGAMNASRRLPEGLRSKSKIKDLIEYYQKNFRSGDHIFATYQVISSVCKKGDSNVVFTG